MLKNREPKKKKKSIFRSLFVPLFLIMILQACIFYFAAVNGGIEQSLSQNAVDISSQRLINRKNELETVFNNSWNDMDNCVDYLDDLYSSYISSFGDRPLLQNDQNKIQFLNSIDAELIETLRQNSVNGIFMIINDQPTQDALTDNITAKKYGLCIRDMDSTSSYTDTSDLLLERAPSSIADQTGCSLDSCWEAQYSFDSIEDGDFYYEPLNAAFKNAGAEGEDLAYFSGAHQLSDSSLDVVSYSIPLIGEDGYPYGVVGFEISTKYLATLIPHNSEGSGVNYCYVLALQQKDSTDCLPIVANGALYNRCFSSDSVLSTADTQPTGGFLLTGRGKTKVFGSSTPLTIYNNNNPFEDTQLVLLRLADYNAMFSYIGHIKQVLLIVSLLSLVLGLFCILFVSRRFAAPITALARRVENMEPQAGFELERLGIAEIDQLVDSIETLNRNVSKDIARTEFFSRMSHDMRTPMNAIISFSSPELLENADETTKDNYLEKIHFSGEYLLGLINEVLDMTKIESKKTELHLAPTLISHTWETVISIIEKLAQKKNQHFIKDIIDYPDLWLLADEQHLNQILVNLLSNAVKFTPDNGEIELHISIDDKHDDPEYADCNITIRDSGIGIGQDFMKNLYTPFEQENDSREGTGLGLSIAKKLVELMGGVIECESTKGMGTTFFIYLSMKKCDAPSAVLPAVPEKVPTVSLEGKKILVCEDHPMNMQIICRLLERKGIEVTATENGLKCVEAFAHAPENTFHGILMDIRMPVMDGLTAAERIRSLNRKDAASIPIIAMTANAFAEDVRASHKAGMNVHLSKPIEPDKLYSTLETLIKE